MHNVPLVITFRMKTRRAQLQALVIPALGEERFPGEAQDWEAFEASAACTLCSIYSHLIAYRLLICNMAYNF